MFDQTQRVYTFEYNHVEPYDNSYLSADDIRQVINYISSYFSIPKPKLIIKKNDSHCRAYMKENKISISDWGRTYTTVLHELSHLIDYSLTKCSTGPHGPSFVGISIHLYSKYLNLPKNYLYEKATKMGIEVFDIKFTSTPKSDFFDDDF